MKLIMENFRKFIELNESANPVTIKKIQDAISQAGGESYITGGAVRDALMPDVPESKDVDFIVTGLPLKDIAEVLAPLGKVNQVGAAFGVVIANIDGEDFDIAIPRTGETKTGEGHGDFDVTTDHTAPVESDLQRRDFTMNAMARDSEGNLIDQFGGQEDIKNKIIRAVGDPNERFAEDPLRMLRALQFAVRFEFEIEPKTAEAIKKLSSQFKSISEERILGEFKKAWTKGKRNSEHFIKLLAELGVGETLFGPEFQPKPVQLQGGFESDPEALTNGNFVAFFLHGGDSSALKPSNDMLKHLQLAQSALKGEQDVWQFGGKDKAKLPLVAEVLKSFDPEAAARIDKALTLPMTPKELVIGGKDLMSLGLKGPQIGQAQQEIMRAIHRGEIQNEPEDIEEFLRSKLG
jgi:tRNA nucleotidyltransferase/poly(A) polymerase